jgi:mRNA interferase RelE/StbE
MSDSPRRYRVELLRDPEKVLVRLTRNTRVRIENALDTLGENPRPHGYSKLKGHDDLYRVRVGEWRIVYAIEDDRLVVLVIEIGPRGSVYQGMSR